VNRRPRAPPPLQPLLPAQPRLRETCGPPPKTRKNACTSKLEQKSNEFKGLLLPQRQRTRPRRLQRKSTPAKCPRPRKRRRAAPRGPLPRKKSSGFLIRHRPPRKRCRRTARHTPPRLCTDAPTPRRRQTDPGAAASQRRARRA
jgi:hypothetical protein